MVKTLDRHWSICLASLVLARYALGVLASPIDRLDARLIGQLADAPRAGVLELARRLKVARGTVQARLDKLVNRGVVTGFGPDLHLGALGYEVTAFVNLEITQGRLGDVVNHLRLVPEVLEAHAITGPGDLHCRVAARTNEHLQDIINRILEVQGIGRSTTVIALSEQIPYRVLPLVGTLARDEA
jgi:DNA-binding Lrp family transcriptional regulator